ncbi:unnamed protein product [Gadus morhua 'NCC']
MCSEIRNQCGQERLSDLLLLSIEKDIPIDKEEGSSKSESNRVMLLLCIGICTLEPAVLNPSTRVRQRASKTCLINFLQRSPFGSY